MATVDGKGRTFWTPLVDEFERTDGITQAVSARQHSIKADTYRNRAERKSTQDTPPVSFVEVEGTAALLRPMSVLEFGVVWSFGDGEAVTGDDARAQICAGNCSEHPEA